MMKQLPDLSKMEPESPASEPQSPPNPESEASSTHSSETTSSAYGEPEWEAMEGQQAEPESDAETDGQALLSKDDFFGVFKMAFAIPNAVPVGPFPIQSLPISPQEEEAARAASDVIYEIAAETPALRWMIEPGNVWIQRAIVIGQFAAIKVSVVAMELRARNAKPVQQAGKPEGGAKPASGPEKFAEPV